MLERFGVGIEPDVRFGGRSISRRSPAVLFRQAGVPTTSPSDGYAAALVALELCAAVAAADGVVDDDEQAMLVEQVNRVENLTDSERVRLDAHRVLLTTSALPLDDVASRVVGLPEDQRLSLGAYLLAVARVDGKTTADELSVLRSVYELLDLDPGEVDRQLRPRTIPLQPQRPPELFTLRPSTDAEPDTAEPSLLSLAPADDLVVPADAEEHRAESVRLVQVDEDRLKERQADNHTVQTLLGAIFADDDGDEHEEAAPAEQSTTPPSGTIASLDTAHSALLRDLAGCDRTSRRDLERAAARHGVLPDGALDVINEAALDLTEDPVVDIHDDESVTIDPDIYQEMRA